jgi:ribosomal protein S18 acetylase RimI-like enzyme
MVAAMTFRLAKPADAPAIAALHAASWREAYPHILSADWLANDVAADRLQVWTRRYAPPDLALRVLLAEDAEGLAGFVSLFLAADPQWGTHVDNLHVHPGLKGQGLGRRLLAAAAGLSLAEAPGLGLDLFVYSANTAARGFYAKVGGEDVMEWLETAPDGSRQLVRRIWWPDPAALLEPVT